MNPVAIVFIIIGAVAVAAGIFCFFYFVVFRNVRTQKSARELVGIFESSHAVLFGEITQYVKRLETISSLNLSYAQDYADWQRKFRDIRDVSDASAQNAADQIQDMLDDRRFRALREELPQYRNELEDYQKRVEALSRSLKTKFLEEEETRQDVLALGDRYRSLKQNYFARQSDLSIISASFEKVFQKIDDLFNQVNENIENAQYGEAKRILNSRINPIITELSSLVVRLPNMCVAAQSVLPDKLSSLKYRYESLIKAGYPLHHIILNEQFEGMRREIKSIVTRLQSFEVSGIDKDIEEMANRIDDYGRRFDEEEKAREIFDSEHDKIYSDENAMESRFINLCHAIPKIRKIYLFTSDDQNLIDQIQQTINISGATKRSLDTYEHSVTRQPYSILVDKMHELRDQSNEATSQIDSFQKYLVSMKNDTEVAADSLPYYASRIREAECAVREINIPNVSARYEETIDSIYQMIDHLYGILSETPIDAREVNKIYQELKGTADALLELLDKEKISLKQAEDAVVKANRFRSSSGNDALLRQAEELFLSGEFDNAFEMALHVKDPLQEPSSNL